MSVTSFELVGVFAATLDAGQEQTVRTQVRAGRTLRSLSFAIRLAFFAVFCLALWCFWWVGPAGHHEDWGFFWDAANFLLLPSTALGFLDMLAPKIRLAFSQSLMLRRAALIGDDRLAPQVAAQPMPLSGAELPLSVANFGTLLDAASWGAQPRITAGVLACISGIAFAGLAILLHQMVGPLAPLDSLNQVLATGTIALCAVGAICMLALGLWGLWRELGIARGVRFTADDWSLHRVRYRRRMQKASLAWHEAQALYMATVQQKPGLPEHTLYALDGGARALTWTLPLRPNSQQRVDHERLLRLIVARTGLPLRDLSVGVGKLAQEPDATEEGQAAAPAIPAATSLAAMEVSPADPIGATDPAQTRAGCWWLLVAFAPLLLTLALSAAGWLWQHFLP
jgi:hypothetical protein